MCADAFHLTQQIAVRRTKSRRTKISTTIRLTWLEACNVTSTRWATIVSSLCFNRQDTARYVHCSSADPFADS